MSGETGYQVLAKAFSEEDVDTVFTLMGDGNMHWSVAMAEKQNAKVVHARHEHAAVAMAEGYARKTGKVGVASVTSGPGFTQIMTALAIGARGNVPMVVFAGDAPLSTPYNVQSIDQGPLTAATGALHVQIKHVDRMLDCVRDAFYLARTERKPVVLTVPVDLQKAKFPHLYAYMTSDEIVPKPQRISPDPDLIEQASEMILQAERPILLAGKGALWSGAAKQLEDLAEHIGAPLATSLFAKGLFNENPYDIGIAGSFSSPVARQCFAEADLIVAVGAGLGHYTSEAGYLYPNASVIDIDIAPKGLWQGLRVADLHVKADAKAGAEALLASVRQKSSQRTGFRTPELRATLKDLVFDPKEYPARPNLVDTRAILLELDRTIPKDWDIVCGGAHFFHFVMTHMNGRPPERWHVINDFGAIGSALPAAVGVATTRDDGKLLLIDGDGSLMMHLQELDTIRRHDLRMLIAVMNDGGYGSEFHKFRAAGMGDAECHHGRGSFGEIAGAFGMGQATVTEEGSLANLLKEYEQGDRSALWDLHIDDSIPSPPFRRLFFGEE